VFPCRTWGQAYSSVPAKVSKQLSSEKYAACVGHTRDQRAKQAGMAVAAIVAYTAKVNKLQVQVVVLAAQVQRHPS
jgi:hypothetical protein